MLRELGVRFQSLIDASNGTIDDLPRLGLEALTSSFGRVEILGKTERDDRKKLCGCRCSSRFGPEGLHPLVHDIGESL